MQNLFLVYCLLFPALVCVDIADKGCKNLVFYYFFHKLFLFYIQLQWMGWQTLYVVESIFNKVNIVKNNHNKMIMKWAKKVLVLKYGKASVLFFCSFLCDLNFFTEALDFFTFFLAQSNVILKEKVFVGVLSQKFSLEKNRKNCRLYTGIQMYFIFNHFFRHLKYFLASPGIFFDTFWPTVDNL